MKQYRNPRDHVRAAENMNSIVDEKNVYLFGAGQIGRKMKQQLDRYEIELCGFLDNNTSLYSTSWEELPIQPLHEVDPQNAVIILSIALSNPDIPAIIQQLEKAGFSEERGNLFDYEFALQVLQVYRKNYTSMVGCTLPITQKCSLNCKYCSVFTPHICEPQHFPLSVLKEDADVYFAAIDYTMEFNILGGEPFLHPDLEEIITYIGENYLDQMGFLKLTTNGTILPSQSLLETMNRFHVHVTLSDYTEALPHLTERVERFVEALRSYPNITLIRFVTDHWIDFGYETVDRSEATDEEMRDLFDRCRMPCRIVKDKKLYYCANSRFAQDAGFVQGEYDTENGFDLSGFVRGRDEKKLFAFQLGCFEKGYVELCRKCNGYLGINHHYIPVAEQAPRR